jgi:hypothetical protein
MHIFRHLFVCFQTSVYTLEEFHKNRNNSTVIPFMLLLSKASANNGDERKIVIVSPRPCPP